MGDKCFLSILIIPVLYLVNFVIGVYEKGTSVLLYLPALHRQLETGKNGGRALALKILLVANNWTIIRASLL